MSQELTLNNGLKIPTVGFGTSRCDELEEALDIALATGYRHIDAAYFYQNEDVVGKVLNNWLSSGKIRREELFVVSKLPHIGCQEHLVEKYLNKSLKSLQLDYVDLYLIHHPIGMFENGDDLFPKDERGNLMFNYNTDHIPVWRAMENLVHAGKIKSIGVSNFNSHQIKRIADNCKIRPAVLHVELHLYCQQRELVAFCKALDIVVLAYFSLGSPNHSFLWTQLKPVGLEPYGLTELPVVQEIAAKHQKTTAQILLRHIIQREVGVVVKSRNPDRIRSNIELFDFKLSEEEVEVLDALDRRKNGRLMRWFIFGLEDHPENPELLPY